MPSYSARHVQRSLPAAATAASIAPIRPAPCGSRGRLVPRSSSALRFVTAGRFLPARDSSSRYSRYARVDPAPRNLFSANKVRVHFECLAACPRSPRSARALSVPRCAASGDICVRRVRRERASHETRGRTRQIHPSCTHDDRLSRVLGRSFVSLNETDNNCAFSAGHIQSALTRCPLPSLALLFPS